MFHDIGMSSIVLMGLSQAEVMTIIVYHKLFQHYHVLITCTYIAAWKERESVCERTFGTIMKCFTFE